MMNFIKLEIIIAAIAIMIFEYGLTALFAF